MSDVLDKKMAGQPMVDEVVFLEVLQNLTGIYLYTEWHTGDDDTSSSGTLAFNFAEYLPGTKLSDVESITPIALRSTRRLSIFVCMLSLKPRKSKFWMELWHALHPATLSTTVPWYTYDMFQV